MRELREKPVRKPWSPTRRRGGTLEEQIGRTLQAVEPVEVPEPEVLPADPVNVGIGAKPAAPRELTLAERELERERKAIDEAQRKIGRELREGGMDWIRKFEPSKLSEALAMVREGTRIERDAMPGAASDPKIPNLFVAERTRWMTVRN